MGNELDITKISIITTHVFSILRAAPEEMDLIKYLTDLKRFYLQEMKAWNYDEFMLIYKDNCPEIPYEEFLNQDVYFSVRFTTLTDNVEVFSNFRAVFAQLYDHALLLCRENKINQLKDFFHVIHCLPEALLWKKKWHSRAFWNHRIKRYCKRWNVKFPGMRKYFFRFFFFNRRSF